MSWPRRAESIPSLSLLEMLEKYAKATVQPSASTAMMVMTTARTAPLALRLVRALA